MKRFSLFFIYSLLLAVPAIILAFTEHYSFFSAVASLLFPAGIYLLWSVATPRLGGMIMGALPIMGICAFEIVIIHLFKGSVIAIDMITNLFTTSSAEIGSLLYQLIPAIIFVCVLYIPLLIYGFILERKRFRADKETRKRVAIAGITLSVAGLLSIIPAKAVDSNYQISRELFPINVLHNTVESFRRWNLSEQYPQFSRAFRFNPKPKTNCDGKEVYVLVIGEASRACSWELGGYSRPTTPLLSQQSNLVFFNNVLTESNTTHKSVSMLLSDVSALDYDSIYFRKSIVSLFKEAGFATFFLSNQVDNRSFIDYFALEADYMLRISDYDMAGLSHITDAIRRTDSSVFIVFHTYGSHFDFKDRYPNTNIRFTPDEYTSVNPKNRDAILNAYDNSIVYTDTMLSSLIGTLDSLNLPTALLYCADHGEDVMDDKRERFLHASPTPTYFQLHVAAFTWFSDEYIRLYPNKLSLAQTNSRQKVSSSLMVFHTIADMAAIECESVNQRHSIVSDNYVEMPRLYLNDYNEAVPVAKAGITPQDAVWIEEIGSGESPFR